MINCLILEDNFAFAIKIQLILKNMGLRVYSIASNIQEAKDIIENKVVDLILSDVVLEGGEKATDLLKNLEKKIPIIFFSSYKNQEILTEVESTKPYIFLLKPIDNVTIESAVRGALRDKLQAKDDNSEIVKGSKTVFLKSKGVLEAINPEEIMFVHSEGNHCSIYMVGRKMVIRSSLQNILDKVNLDSLAKTHRSYLVNITYIDNVNVSENTIVVRDRSIPLGRKYKKGFLEMFN